jgi:hypothetical protein
VAIKGVRHVAAARVLSSCPDYAPDRRPFNSLADDLIDRDKGRMDIGNSAHDLKETQAEVADLFERVFETSSLMNLDALRDRAVKENLSGTSPSEFPKAPHIDERSMTAGDRPYADDLAAALFPYPASPPLPSGPQPTPLPYSDLAHFRHGPLCDEDTLIDFLNAYAERVRDLIRPPFGRFAELAAPKKRNKSARPFRDPRDDRDGYHDMRMPPYMRDSDQNSLSITYRQYHALMDLLDKITAPPSKAAVKAAAKAKAALGAERKAKKSPEQVRAQRIADSARLRREGPITRQVEEFTKRRGDR